MRKEQNLTWKLSVCLFVFGDINIQLQFWEPQNNNTMLVF